MVVRVGQQRRLREPHHPRHAQVRTIAHVGQQQGGDEGDDDGPEIDDSRSSKDHRYTGHEAKSGDVNAIEAAAMLTVTIAMATRLIGDLAYTLLNPRIRYA